MVFHNHHDVSFEIVFIYSRRNASKSSSIATKVAEEKERINKSKSIFSI